AIKGLRVPLDWTCSGNPGHMWEEISSHLEVEENESRCPKTRESALLLNGPLQGRPPRNDALLDLDPLRIVEFDQLKLRRSELRTIQGRMTDLMQPALAPIIRTAILCQERLPIGDLELSVGDPDRHALPRQARLGIDVEAVDTNKALGIHGPQKLPLAKQ